MSAFATAGSLTPGSLMCDIIWPDLVPGGLSSLVRSIVTASTMGGSHSPQSSAQLTQVSPASQTASPQVSSASALPAKHPTHKTDTLNNMRHLSITYPPLWNAALKMAANATAK